ncbi:hypothetical protein C8J56DRAFT_1094829 [Mycena floridula]|nr:hypothetical protein C8J56DRAFT_1094829 [Mycena floridula]
MPPVYGLDFCPTWPRPSRLVIIPSKIYQESYVPNFCVIVSVHAPDGCPSRFVFDGASIMGRCKTFHPTARATLAVAAANCQDPDATQANPAAEDDVRASDKIPEIPQTGGEQAEKVNPEDNEAVEETQEADEEQQEADEERQQVGEEKQDASIGSADADANASATASTDANADVSTDANADVSTDANADVSTDANADVSTDSNADANADVSTDASAQLIEAYLLNLVQDDSSGILEVIKSEMASSTNASMSSSPSNTATHSSGRSDGKKSRRA